MTEFFENGMNRYANEACVKIPYIHTSLKDEDLKTNNLLEQILQQTPTKGQPFSSIHIVSPPATLCNNRTGRVLEHFHEEKWKKELMVVHMVGIWLIHCVVSLMLKI